MMEKISAAKREDGTAGLGKVFLQPRQVAELAYAHGIVDAADLATSVAVCFAESQAGIQAWHDNLGPDGVVLSRDVGLWQINIPAAKIGTDAELALYSPDANAAAMFALYRTRHFQPWAAYNSGVYLHDHYAGSAALALCNLAAERFNQAGATLPLPMFSTKDLRAKLATSI